MLLRTKFIYMSILC